MLQPFEILTPYYVEQLIIQQKTYFVTQSYPRGNSPHGEAGTIPILVSVYGNPGLAKTHWNAVKVDPMAAIIDLNKPEHHRKLREMLAGDKYRIFWSVVRNKTDLEKTINTKYKHHMRRYIEQHTDWQISTDTTLRPSMQTIFGELYIILRHSTQLIRVKFGDIEKC